MEHPWSNVNRIILFKYDQVNQRVERPHSISKKIYFVLAASRFLRLPYATPKCL